MTPQRLPDEIWSNNPLARIHACRSVDSELLYQHVKGLIAKCPNGRWPFGMPTSINPYLLMIGVSPGGGEQNCEHYAAPTAGIPHSGYGGEYAPLDAWWRAPYWEKNKELARKTMKFVEPRLSDHDAIALTGHLNLGTKNFGEGGIQAVEKEIIEWLPSIISDLQPKIILCYGWKSLCQKTTFFGSWEGTILEPILGSGNPIALKACTSKSYAFESIPLANGSLAVRWPNHPSKHPFTDPEIWDAAIREFLAFLRFESAKAEMSLANDGSEKIDWSKLSYSHLSEANQRCTETMDANENDEFLSYRYEGILQFIDEEKIWWLTGAVKKHILPPLMEVLARLPDAVFAYLADRLFIVVEDPEVEALATNALTPQNREGLETVVIFHHFTKFSKNALIGLLAHEFAHTFCRGGDYQSDEALTNQKAIDWGFQKELQFLCDEKAILKNPLH